jgi:tetratricopeptide (TPR) repeat protein
MQLRRAKLGGRATFYGLVLAAWGATGSLSAAAQADRELEEALSSLNRAKYLHQEKRYDEAIAEYRRSIKLNDQDPWVHNYLGLALAAKRDFKEALKSFERALAINPELTDVHNNMGVVYDQLGRREKAFEAFTRVVRDPTYPTAEKAYYNLGELYLRDKNYDLAIMHFQKAVEKKPRFAMGYRGLGYVYTETGKRELAIEEFKKAIENDPRDVPSLFELARLSEQAGRTEEALGFYRRVVEADRFSALGRMSLAKLESRTPVK